MRLDLFVETERIENIMTCSEEQARDRTATVNAEYNELLAGVNDAGKQQKLLLQKEKKLKNIQQMLKRMRKGIGLTILLGSPFMGRTIDEDTGEEGKRVCVPQTSLAIVVKHSENIKKMKRSNRPSGKGCETLVMPKSEARNDETVLSLPLNAWGWMKRAQHYLLLPNGLENQSKEPEHFFAGMYNAKHPVSGHYVYRKGCMDHINALAHEDVVRKTIDLRDAIGVVQSTLEEPEEAVEKLQGQLKSTDYLFGNQYPLSSSFHEYMSYDHEYDCSKKLGERWLKRVPTKEVVHSDLPESLLNEIFGSASFGDLRADISSTLPTSAPRYDYEERQRLMLQGRQQQRERQETAQDTPRPSATIIDDEWERRSPSPPRVVDVTHDDDDDVSMEGSDGLSDDGSDYSPSTVDKARAQIDAAYRQANEVAGYHMPNYITHHGNESDEGLGWDELDAIATEEDKAAATRRANISSDLIDDAAGVDGHLEPEG